MQWRRDGIQHRMVRPQPEITVSPDRFEVTGEDLLGRALLHETDHLNGKLYISHISALKRDLMKRKIRKLMKQGEW